MQADLWTLIDALSHDGNPRIWGRTFDNSSISDIATRYYWAAISDFPPAGSVSAMSRLATPITTTAAPRRLAATPRRIPNSLPEYLQHFETQQNSEYANAAIPNLLQYREFANEILGASLETVFGSGRPTDERRLIVLYNASLLESVFRSPRPVELANCFHLSSLAVYEILNHFSRYVVSRVPDDPAVKAFSEHLVHPSLDCFLGLTLLSQFHAVATDPESRLANVVGRILKDRLSSDKGRQTTLAQRLGLSTEAFQELVDDELGTSKREKFVYDAWLIAALLHDIGYYVASLWDLHNLLTRIDGELKPTAHALEIAAGLPAMDLRPNGIPSRFERLLGLSDFITEEQLSELQVVLRLLALGPTRPGYTMYLQHAKQLHPFWSAFELLARLETHGDILDARQRLLLYVAIDAIYPHQFPSKHDANAVGSPRLAGVEAALADKHLVFRENPLAFCLYVVDNCQNFARFHFASMPKRKRRARALTIPMLERHLEVRFEKDHREDGCDILRLGVVMGGKDHKRKHVRDSGFIARTEQSNSAEDAHRSKYPNDRHLFYVHVENRPDGRSVA